MRKILSLSQSDISVDRRLTVGTPSGFNAKSLLKRLSVAALFLFAFMGNAWGEANGAIASSIAADDQIIIINKDANKELTGVSSDNIGTVAAYTGTPAGTYVLTVEAGKSGSGFSFKLSDGSYLAYTSSSTSSNNYLYTLSDPSTNNQNKQVSWNVTFDANNQATITNIYNTSRKLQYNSGASRFCCYTGSQQAVKIFKLVAVTKSAVTITNPEHGTISVLNGEEAVATGTEVEEKTELAVSIADVEGYRFALKAVGTESNEVVAITDGKIEMPAFPITITADETALFKVQVAVNDAQMGTATINGGASVYTDGNLTLNLVAEAKPGYEFVNWTASSEYLGADETNKASTTATALAAGTLTANFKESVTPAIALSEETLEFAAVAKGAAVPAAQTFTITGANLTGDLALAWDAEGDDAFTYEITAGSLTATDGAVSATIAVTPKSTATAGNFANTLTVSGGGAAAQEVLVGFEVLETYTATWHVNGSQVDEQTAVAGTTLEFPADPVASGDCADLFFQGWVEAPLAEAQEAAPAYTSKTEMPEANVNFYAVFATKGVSEGTKDEIASVTISEYATAHSWSSSSSSGQKEMSINSDITATVTATDANSGKYYTDWRLYQSGDATVTIATTSGTLKSVMFTFTNSNSGTLTYNSSALTSGTAVNVSGTSAEFAVANSGSATNGQIRLTGIEVVYEVSAEQISYSDFLTTCPHCNTVTLAKSDAEHGAFTFKVNGVEATSVKTCEGATVDVVFAPAEGYELESFAISDDVEGATYSEGVISIPEGATGTLTATATFKLADYTVTMAQEGGAEATLSDDQTGKHMDDVITVTAENKDGFYFLGWEADPAVTFADAEALSTTFTMPASNVTVTAKYAKVYTLAELATAGLDVNTVINVKLDKDAIKSIYKYNSNPAGVTFDVQINEGEDLRIFFNNQETISGWQVGGKLSGLMLNAKLTQYKGEWQITPALGFAWSDLTYEAPSVVPTALDNTAVEAKAVKSLQNGMLIIEKGGKKFNAQGQLIK